MRHPRSFRLIQVSALLFAIGVSGEAILHPYPQRDTAVVVFASLALCVAMVARMVELRWFRRLLHREVPSFDTRARLDET
jgi:hypothetical protein